MIKATESEVTRVIIIGYMGSGKTTVGIELAKRVGFAFYDLDWYIESRMRKTVKQLFDERGEEGFRTIEHNMLHEVAEFENVVVSCGGGTPCFYDNMDYLNNQGKTVYLKAEPKVLLRHLKMGKSIRPLILDKSEQEMKEFIVEQLTNRTPFYEKAQYILDVSLLDNYEKIQTSVEQIHSLLFCKAYKHNN